MQPYFEDAGATLLLGDAGAVLRELAPGSVQTCITSPPYFGLRDYGAGAEEVGREATPAAYVARLVEVMRDVRRVLADDGTLWLILGDSYSGAQTTRETQTGLDDWKRARGSKSTAGTIGSADGTVPGRPPTPGLPDKNLIGVPWRVALALQADGWYLRSDIIWHKPNSLPESVTDRPTGSHEYLFLLAKRGDYFYDAEAIKEPAAESTRARAYLGQRPVSPKTQALVANGFHGATDTLNNYDREVVNKRSVWTVPTRPYAGAHFATFPEALVEPCLLAGARLGDTVLDPFCGSGTVGAVARRYGRRFVGIDLNPEYLALAAGRVAQLSLWDAAVTSAP